MPPTGACNGTRSKIIFMDNPTSTNSQSSPESALKNNDRWSLKQWLHGKQVSFLTLPLLFMATVTEFVILATGWKYQQTVCVPLGMGVTFFGIGPIGATILAVELLKLPLAIWTASRCGWQKWFMLTAGLPLICLLTFQLVKDMAVYEMGAAMKPASELLEQAATEEGKITRLNAELANQLKDEGAVKSSIAEKKAERDRKVAEVAAKQGKAKAEIEESLKRNDASRQDAITLTDFQKKELADVDSRQTGLIKQSDADAAQLTKAIADLRVRRETELGRAATWNVEEARIENDFKARMAEYTNKKTTHEKDKAEYDSANVLKRQLMREPVDPGVPPQREANKILKPTLVAELEAQIKAKESELAVVNNKRRDSVAQVGSDARKLRDDFARRSGTKREESDRKREDMLATLTQVTKESAAELKQIDKDYETAVQKDQDSLKSRRPVEIVRAELDASRKKADGLYEARETAIKNTQVHRIATTVEILRGLIKGESPASIKSTAKERGDIYTDQISMVRIWVYPLLAFIVAFLPTLMVEIGFSTIFQPEEKQRRPHRLGFFGRRLHWLYTRAGRIKILRAERLAREAAAEIARRDEALAVEKATAASELSSRDAELQEAQMALAEAAAAHEEQLQQKEEEWVAKFSGMADSLNRTVLEKDALRDLQKSEIERQIQMRQNAWSERTTQLRQELDEQRAAAETERTSLMQEHHKKLMEVTEDCKTQVIQARRQLADAELANVEAAAKLANDLKEALYERDRAESELKHSAESLTRQLSLAQEDAARELEKAVRQEKQRFDKQQAESERTSRLRDEETERRLKQQQQELSLAFDTRLLEEKNRAEQDARRRQVELERQVEDRARESDARWAQEIQQREDAAEIKLKQREQQLQAQAEVRAGELQAKSDQELRRREQEFERQLDSQARDAEARLRDELQQKELTFHAKIKQREQDLTTRAADRETELQNKWAADLRSREVEWEKQTESRVRAVETRQSQEAQQKEELFQIRINQREQQLQSQFEARQAEARRRQQELLAQITTQSEAHRAAQKEWDTELELVRSSVESLKANVARVEQERDDTRRSASESVRHVQDLEKKLMEASSFLTGWKNGKEIVGSRDGRDASQVLREGSEGTREP